MLSSHPQIIQTEGSYSFLLCGMIIGCMGFILFIGLMLFHRMHINYLTGRQLTNFLLKLPHCWGISNYSYMESYIDHVHYPPPPSPHPTQTQQGHLRSQPWWRSLRPNRTVLTKQNIKRKKRAAEKGSRWVNILPSVVLDQQLHVTYFTVPVITYKLPPTSVFNI